MKLLRKARGFSQAQAMPKGMSKYTYSKFENDRQSLKAEQIFEILDNIQVTYQEFYTLLNRKNSILLQRELLISFASDPTEKENKKGILNIYNTLNNSENLKEVEFAMLLDIKGLFSSYIKEIPKIDSKDLKQIKKIISKKKYFTFYDYKLVSNHIMNFSKKDIEFFVETMFPVENIHLRDIETRNVISQFFVNLVTKFMYSNDRSEAKKYLNLARENNKEYRNYYFSIQIQYFEYIVAYLETSEPDYLTKANYLMKAVEDIGDINTAKTMRLEYKELLKEEKIDMPIGSFPTVITKDS